MTSKEGLILRFKATHKAGAAIRYLSRLFGHRADMQDHMSASKAYGLRSVQGSSRSRALRRT